ncbi:MAG TPA: polynucleotide adenylyltransferase, partial [Roseiflexaceae bacterium]|nr:polynucleotide adenylyltransferase [Roseiflexaceae bacterium]
LLGYTTSDIDLEVYGIEPAPLRELLERHGHVEAVGRAFAVLKVRRADGSFVDIALPRAESSSGRRGVVGGMPDMLPRDAAARRDFSCNALALTADGELLDFYGGVADLHAGVLRHVSPAFADDPLRVLRAMRLAARFNMQLAPATAEFCRTLVPRAAELPLERIWGEWRQWSERGAYPAAGLRVLAASGWLACYPQIQALDGCAQHHLYHPEGDV